MKKLGISVLACSLADAWVFVRGNESQGRGWVSRGLLQRGPAS